MTKYARWIYGFISLCVLVVVPMQIALAVQNKTGEFAQPFYRGVNVLCYFTVLSNIMVGVASYLLARMPEKNSAFRDVVQLSSLVCITVTGIIYHLLLASTDHPKGLGVFTNICVHTVIPVLYVFCWSFFGPHGRATLRVTNLAIAIPIVWAVFAMIRGSIVHYYPYPFMDVRDLGYATALVNMAAITVFFLVLFYGAAVLDRALDRKKSTDGAS